LFQAEEVRSVAVHFDADGKPFFGFFTELILNLFSLGLHKDQRVFNRVLNFQWRKKVFKFLIYHSKQNEN